MEPHVPKDEDPEESRAAGEDPLIPVELPPAPPTTPAEDPPGAVEDTPSPPVTAVEDPPASIENPPASPDSAGATATSPGGGANRQLLFEPTTTSGWVQPGYAFWVVAIVALVILGILGVAISELDGVASADGKTRLSDPDASTIAALAAAAFTALSSLTAAYFGIKVASEQSAQATEQANKTTHLALQVANNANSTANGNPSPDDFG